MKQKPEAREKFTEKEREICKKRRECGKIKLIANLTPREQRQRRKEWRTRQNKCRQKKKLLKENDSSENSYPVATPSNPSQVADGRRLSGRKRVRKERSAVYRALIKSQEKYKKMTEKFKKRSQRNTENKQPLTPKRKVNRIASKNEIRKKLLFGVQKKAKTISTETEKRKFINFISGKIIKKYRLLQKTKSFLSNRQRQNIGCQPVKRQRKSNVVVTLELKDKVVRFFEDDASSALTPRKKEFITKNKIRKQKRILLFPLKKLHQKFNQNFGSSISYSTFCKLKPFWVVHPKVNQRDTCLCIKHANFQYLIDKLHFLKLLLQNSSHDVSATVCCDTSSKACMYRQCSRCKHKTLAITVSEDKKKEETFYYQWSSKTEERKNKDKMIRVKFTVKKKIVSTVEELINEAQTGLNTFLKHSYNYHHQVKSMKSLRTSLNPTEVVIDFSENYLCKYASEVQSAHFGASKQQITLHTGVIYAQNMLLQEEITSFCTISNILRHDASAVWAHIVPVIKLIKEKYPDIDTIHFQSDGPTTQYRNRTNFYFLALFAKKFNLKAMTWNFTESGHGKGPADGIGGIVKRTADEIVAFGSDANILFESAANLKIQFFQISEDDINIIDDLKPEGKIIPSIPNIMKLHQLTWNKLQNSKLQLRYLSCFACDTHEKCLHHSSEPSFVDLSLCFKKNTLNDCEDSQVLVDDLENEPINVGAWVAVVYHGDWFPGLIEDINDDILTISFMLRNGTRFYWPNVQDIQEVPKNELLCCIQIPPRPVTSRYFVIDSSYDINLKMKNISH